MNEKDPQQPFHASARLISPIILLPQLPDVDCYNDDGSPGTRLQSQMFDAASNFPAPRRQNTACDACRSRKVKCNQVSGQDKCLGVPCYWWGGANPHAAAITSNKQPKIESAQEPPHRNQNLDHYLKPPNGLSVAGPSPNGSSSALALSVSPPVTPTGGSNSPTAYSSSHNPTMQLLYWLFAPTETAPPTHIGGSAYQAHRSVMIAVGTAATAAFRNGVGIGTPQAQTPPDWGEIGMMLKDDTFIVKFSLDLIEVYMQICHTRQPILDPIDFRARFKLSLPQHLRPPDTPHQSYTTLEPVPPALLSVVIAWGSKFSEHPILLRDREENNGRSRISRSLVAKAIEVAEGERVYRLPTTEGILTCLIIEGIQTHAKTDPNRKNDDDTKASISSRKTFTGYSKFWVDSAIRLMLELQINRQPEGQGTLVFCWWIACLSDAIGSAYLRRKPLLDDDDYDTRDLAGSSQLAQAVSTADPVVPAAVQAAYLSWYTSLHALARIIRQMCRVLWIPATENDGVPFDALVTLVAQYSQWRDDHLDRVGVPSNFEADWDFVAAVTACSSDATFHLMWIILAQAVEDYGIKESNEIIRTGGGDATTVGTTSGGVVTMPDCEALSNQITQAAQHGALRIAGLAGVLVSNKYLRLDPNALHYALYAAGHMLALAGRSEVTTCIAGLKQYGLAYEDAFDQAAELEAIYSAALEAGASHHSPFANSPSGRETGGGPLHFGAGAMAGDHGQAHTMALSFVPNDPRPESQSQTPLKPEETSGQESGNQDRASNKDINPDTPKGDATTQPPGAERFLQLKTIHLKNQSESSFTGTLDEAHLAREALSLRLKSHPDRIFALNDLSATLNSRYNHAGNVADLIESIRYDQEAPSLCALDHPDRGPTLDNLSVNLYSRHRETGKIVDLTESIGYGREAPLLRTAGHSNRASTFSNLSVALHSRYKQMGDLTDLTESIDNDREALLPRPVGHPDRAFTLNNLSVTLYTRYKATNTFIDLTESVDHGRETISLLPLGHPNRALILRNFGMILESQYRQMGDVTDITKCIKSLKEAAAHVLSPLSVRLTASSHWISKARIHDPSSLSEAYSVALTVFDRSALLVASVHDRRVRLTSNGLKVIGTSVAADAASWAIEQLDLQSAVQLLEQSRSLTLNQLGNYRTPLDDLEGIDKKLVDQFRTLGSTMEEHALSKSEGKTHVSMDSDMFGRYVYYKLMMK
ncbi:hypothetical protein FRB96_008904 [Tulasnella sp. 330]|nr:hypothetical protein FRB96_008904 [Tulasnella sp. 330]